MLEKEPEYDQILTSLRPGGRIASLIYQFNIVADSYALSDIGLENACRLAPDLDMGKLQAAIDLGRGERLQAVLKLWDQNQVNGLTSRKQSLQ